MSTKIYYGFKTGTGDIKVILELVKQYREMFWIKDSNEQYERFLGEYPTKSEGFRVWGDRRREVKKTGYRDQAVDTDFEIVIFPHEDHFVGMVFTEHEDWFDKFLKLPGVREYGYWNNTDPPEHVSDEEWEKRGDTWDDVLGSSGIPSMTGFTISISDPMGPGPWSVAGVK